MRRDGHGWWWVRTPGCGGVLALVVAVVLLSGCRLNTGSEPSRDIRVQLQGDVTTEVELITSNFFVIQQTTTGGASLDFVISDTARVRVPVDDTFSLAPTGQFALRVQAPLADSAVVNLIVSANGSERFRAEGQLLDLDQPLDFFFSGN